MKPDKVLQLFEVSNKLPRCYQVGYFARRVTLFSQQTRAFNLAWALLSSEMVKAGDSVGVVGGGLAGMTVATALSVKGLNVHLYERAADVLHLQRGNRVRYIHPSINDWPGSDYDNHLPYLRWTAGFCDEVADQILRQWKLVESSIHVRRFCSVDAISAQSGGVQVTFEGDDESIKHDCVVLAVGYGFEKQIEKLPWRSYWQNDSLNQPVIVKATKSFLVAGCGDGGLTDALRLSLKDFDHGAFLIDVAETYCEEIFSQLRTIEWVAERRWECEIANGGSEKEAERATRQILKNEYERLSLPAILLSQLRNAVRDDTSVTINNSGTSYLSLKSALINRIAVHALVHLGKIEYLPGEPSLKNITDNGTYVMNIESEGGVIEREFDEVVVRQGTEPTIKGFLSKDDYQTLRKHLQKLEDPSRTKFFPDDFWAEEFSKLEIKLQVGESALRYSVLFLIAEGVDSRDIDEAAADSFAHTLATGCGCEIIETTNHLLVDLPTRRYSVSVDGEVITFTVGTIPAWNGAKYDVALQFSTESKHTLDKLLDAEVAPYARFELVPRASFLKDLYNTGVNIDDLSVTTMPTPRPHIEVERRKGMFSAHRYATTFRCIELLTDQFSDKNNFYDKVVGKKA